MDARPVPGSVGYERRVMSERAEEILWNSFFRLQPESGRPLQVQIRQAVVAAIHERRIPLGARVPASRDLAERLGVARNTVVLAYQQLVDEGFLVSRQRSGYFVAEDVPDPNGGAAAIASEAGGPDWDRLIGPRPSRDRNIAKPKNWLGYPYPFLYGQFDPGLFPINAWRECARMALSVIEIRDWARDLIDGDDAELIEQLRLHVLPRRGVWAAPDEIIVTLGAQQALFLVAALLMRAGSRVGVEDPGYPDARNIFRRMAAEIVPLAVDENGLVVGPDCATCDVLYVTPSSQCPTTATMPAVRREALLALARERDIVLIEDDYETEFLGEGPPTPALKSLDREGRVLYVGSLSKVLAPGLRLGYIVAPEPVVRELRALRRLMLRHPPVNNQRAASLFLSLGHYDSHLRRVHDGLRQRATLVDSALARWFPEFRWRRSRGSSSAWVEGGADLDARALAREAEKRGILIEPGDIFFGAEDPPKNLFRLGFSSIAAERIEPGLKALSEVKRELGSSVAARAGS